MTYDSRRQTGAADAAGILADIKARVDRLEQDDGVSDETVQVFRNVTDTVTVTDSQTITEQGDAAFVFGTSEWSFDEFGYEESMVHPTDGYGTGWGTTGWGD